MVTEVDCSKQGQDLAQLCKVEICMPPFQITVLTEFSVMGLPITGQVSPTRAVTDYSPT